MSEESQDLLEILKGIKFVMYIGGPGTGKTTKLKQIATECKESQGGDGVHIIGPTNLNAQCTGGTTIYRYCNCSYTKFESVPFYYPTVLIDEVFMFSERVFSYILECCNKSTKEIIMFGDPYQIAPPIDKCKAFSPRVHTMLAPNDKCKGQVSSVSDSYFYNAIPEGIEIIVYNLNVYFRSLADKSL